MRSAGILLPISALPAPYGIGTLGAAAYRFLDFLQESGQSMWQILPIGPTGFGDSPYQCFSSFAGNPYFIDLDLLCQEGLLLPSEYESIHWGQSEEQIDYGLLYKQRFRVLAQAAERVPTRFSAQLAAFCQAEQHWLADYALFMALKFYHNGAPWYQWPTALKHRTPAALQRARQLLAKEIHFWKTVQFLFYRQWDMLRQAAAAHGVQIIGDLPIYTAYDSADVWAEPEQFQLDDALQPRFVAGCPPDSFAPTGQLWGNPLFDWDYMEQDGYRWWLRRMSQQLRLFDLVRLDHFRGFDAYYAVPASDSDAKNGQWLPGPGIKLFQALESQLGSLPIIAEDLGFLTPRVYQLLAETGYPGMKVLQFAFDTPDFSSDYLPHRYCNNCVVYPGTHDNDTIIGWLQHTQSETRQRAMAYLRLSPEEGYHWGVIRNVWGSVADRAIIPLQDLLGLSSQARINTPGTLGGNWIWRCRPDAFSAALATRLRTEMLQYGRCNATVLT